MFPGKILEFVVNEKESPTDGVHVVSTFAGDTQVIPDKERPRLGRRINLWEVQAPHGSACKDAKLPV